MHSERKSLRIPFGAINAAGSSLMVSEWTAQLQRTKGALQQLLRPLVKTAAAAVSLGTGASLGPEGPSVEIGKAFASGFGSLLRSKHRHVLSLMAAGSGAGELCFSPHCRWD